MWEVDEILMKEKKMATITDKMYQTMKKDMLRKRMCSECKRGEIYDVPADYIVSGYDEVESRPYRSAVCEEHMEVVADRVNISNIEEISANAWKKRYSEILKRRNKVTESFKKTRSLSDGRMLNILSTQIMIIQDVCGMNS
jgi:hypothetical protein